MVQNWDTLLLSVALDVVIPLGAGVVTRLALDHSKPNQFIHRLKPTSITELLATVILLFGFQVETPP